MNISKFENIIEHSDQFLKGKKEQVKLVLCNLLSRGHTLIEDAPGVGKTTLVKYIGKSIGLEVSRIQFTNDLLPADILGTSIFHKETSNFELHKGPLFGELILADELNRAPPKTQSALLQAMEERQITIDGTTYELPKHFTVMATQNPQMQVGTFNLPESQLDRFSMKIKMGHTNEAVTIELLKASTLQVDLSNIESIISIDELLKSQKELDTIHTSDEIYQLIYKLLESTRTNKDLIALSNRCGIDLVNVSKAWAYLAGRDYVIPDDVHHIFKYVAGHRLVHPENSDVDFEHKMAAKVLANA